MKKIILSLAIVSFGIVKSQFTVSVELPTNYKATEAYLYSYDGSKDVLAAKGSIKSNVEFKVPKSYKGMLRVALYPGNNSINIISENKNIEIIAGKSDNNSLREISYRDEANKLLESEQAVQRKRTSIYPALLQIKEYYKSNDEFYTALNKEITLLSSSSDKIQNNDYPTVKFYLDMMGKYVSNPNIKSVSNDDFINLFVKTDNKLETSSLMKPILISFLNTSNRENPSIDIDKLLDAVDLESPRGQTILSELIEIFDTYDMKDLKEKYLAKAKGLKCTINDRLAGTIKTNDNVALGAVFPNNVFQNSINTKAKSIYDVKANHKVVIFWSSTCSHCVTELPKILEKYSTLKSKNIEVIALSVDQDINSFKDMASKYPWISASEGKGWSSSYTDTYNVHATPTFFILDANNKIINKPDHVQDVLTYFNVK
ncbi:peroxiredoxin family protein [Chryseobacterium sp. T1]